MTLTAQVRAAPGRALLLVAAAALAVGCGIEIAGHGFVDLDVYRAGGRAYLDGIALYGPDFQGPAGLRFIYAPLAAVMVVPFTLLADPVAHGVWTVASVLLVLWVLTAVCSRLGVESPPLAPLVLLAPALLLEPVREALSFGQVDILIVALVVLDCLGVVPARFRGVGIGVAAAIKVTPAAFGLLLLLRRDWASVVRSAAAFLACAVIGWVIDPSDSKQYWTSEFFNSSRGGGAEYGPNQAITGLVARAGLDGSTRTAVWLALSAVVVVAGAWAAHRFTVAGEHVVATGVVALVALLVAPLSVTHHWSYVILLVPLLAARQYRSWRYPLAAVTVLWSLGVVWSLPIGEDLEHERWTWLDQVTGNSPGYSALALLVAAVLAARSRGPHPDARDPRLPDVGAGGRDPDTTTTGHAQGARAGSLSG